MTATHAIDDSEGEEEFSPIKSFADIAGAPEMEGASGGRGTGSTEEQLRDAHLDLIAPTPAADIPAMTISPVEIRKRRNTISDSYEDGSPAKKIKKIKTTRAQSIKSSQQLPMDPPLIASQTLIHHVEPTGDTLPYGTDSQEQIAQALHAQLGTTLPVPQPEINSSGHQPSSPMPWSASTTTSGAASTQYKTTPPSHSNGPPSDDLVGLAKEQYKPRPSRSRSTQVDEQPVDRAAKPEKKAKNMRRTKTTEGGLIKASQGVDAESQHTSSQPTTTTPNLVPEAALEDLTSITEADTASDHLTAQAPMEPNATPQEFAASQHSNVQVIISSKNTDLPPPPKPKAKPTKSRRSHTTIFEDHVGLEATQPSQSLGEQQATRKKRGRPKKVAAPPPATPEPQEVAPGQDEPSTDNGGAEVTSISLDKPAQEIVTNIENVTPPGETASVLAQAPDSSPKQAEKRAKEPLGKRDTHTPIQKTKQTFRVGLSKRQSIVPLLRVFRK